MSVDGSLSTTRSTPTPPKKEGERLIRVGIVVFVGAFVGMLAVAALRGRASTAETAAPGFAVSEVARPHSDGSFRVTLDASDSDAWVPFNLSSGRVCGPGELPDIEARRFTLRAAGGALDFGGVSFDDVVIPAKLAWVPDEGEGDDADNPVLSRWYDYSLWSHKLKPKGATYGVRLASSPAVALIKVESYECEPEGAGCLTLRYRIVPSETR